MLERLQIRNFQKHELLRLTFAAPGVTTITGDNDKGKSTIIRALYWLAFNRPSTDTIRRRDNANQTIPEDCAVTLWFDGGQKVTRRRGDDSNEYTFGTDVYTALNRMVPEDIATALNLSDGNFLLQLDPPFWFTKTGSKLSEALNAVVNLNVIDETLEDLRSRLRRAKTVHDVSTERLEKAKAEKHALKFVPVIAEEFATLEIHAARLCTTQTHGDNLRTAITNARTWCDRAAAMGRLATLGAAALAKGAAANKVAQRAATLRTTITNARTANGKRLHIDDNILKTLEYARARWLTKDKRRALLSQYVSEAKSALGHISRTRGDLNNAEANFNSLTNGALCPVCEKPFHSQ